MRSLQELVNEEQCALRIECLEGGCGGSPGEVAAQTFVQIVDLDYSLQMGPIERSCVGESDVRLEA